MTVNLTSLIWALILYGICVVACWGIGSEIDRQQRRRWRA